MDRSKILASGKGEDPSQAQVQPGKWGMSIDQNLCTGCQACVVACAMENNISFVGEDDASYGRQMAWIRIERFWTGEYPDIQGRPYRPVNCQQCGSAPCEPVCPVYAAIHSQAQQINLQVYNRCVGTRYCANNCPYQARTFNWRDYQSDPANANMVDGKLEYPLHNQLNPDVTVRRRGVMEKCTFCIQRLHRAEDLADSQGRAVDEAEAQPACAQVCPANAISFGLLTDPASQVSKQAADPRGSKLLADLNTSPRITYLKEG
jgi:Fe-S-cluster-containing dehydrogenase component